MEVVLELSFLPTLPYQFHWVIDVPCCTPSLFSLSLFETVDVRMSVFGG